MIFQEKRTLFREEFYHQVSLDLGHKPKEIGDTIVNGCLLFRVFADETHNTTTIAFHCQPALLPIMQNIVSLHLCHNDMYTSGFIATCFFKIP